MEEEAPVQVPEDVPVALPGDAPMSAREAGRLLASFRHSRPAQEVERSPLAAEVAQAESGEQPAAPETDPGAIETQAEEPTEELSPIDPPRSWSKEWKEEFQNYPREIQEKISAREQERETALRRGQNEAAELRKALEAQLAQAEQVRKQNEQLYPQLLAMSQQQMGEFSDIKTMADVENLANTDWPRFARFQAAQMKVQFAQQQMQAAEQQRQQEYQQQWTKFAADEDAKFIEADPEFANPEFAAKAMPEAVSMLTSRYGFSEEEIGKLWNGQASLSARDNRFQRMIADNLRYHRAKAAVPKAAAKPVPKVQKPGSPLQRVPDADAREKALYDRLDETRGLASVRLGAQLLAERRAARQR